MGQAEQSIRQNLGREETIIRKEAETVLQKKKVLAMTRNGSGEKVRVERSKSMGYEGARRDAAESSIKILSCPSHASLSPCVGIALQVGLLS